MHVKLAIVAPLVNPTLVPGGSPSISTSQAAATSSTTAAAGVARNRPTFWSQADVSQSAASAAGTEPPMTNPKYLGLLIVVRPGSTAVTSCSITSRASVPVVGSG